ncbi:MAG: MBL fold metallo-hydrolase [Candidatus Thorarchaeota archaeon]|nr:MBL fold metallo-hydrolase [Candidatus Thorarchaeota archaeon]
MLELEPFDDVVTGVKTATAQGGKAIMWAYSYRVDNVFFDAGCANAKEELRSHIKGIERLLVTHSHEDHVGGCSVLNPDIPILAPALAIPVLKSPPNLNEFFQYVWGQPEPIEDVELMPSQFSVGDLEFEVIPLPGHSQDMVGFYEAHNRWFFSADGVPLPSKKRLAMDDENVPQAIATMERILELDLDVLFDFHRGPIRDPQQHIQTRIDFLKGVQNQVCELHKEGKTIEEIQSILNFKPPWYMDLTEGRFGIDYLIRSLIFDRP